MANTTSTKTDTVALELVGTELPMRAAVSKKGNEYFAVMAKNKRGERYMSRYGVPIPALDDMLPTEATVDGKPVTLDPGISTSGNPRVSGGTQIVVNGNPLNVTVSISLKQDGNWNLIAKAIPGGGGGGSRVQSISDL